MNGAHMRCPIIQLFKKKFNFAKFADIHTDGKKVTSKDPFRVYAQDLKIAKLYVISLHMLVSIAIENPPTITIFTNLVRNFTKMYFGECMWRESINCNTTIFWI